MKKNNLKKLSCTVTAQTMYNLNKLSAMSKVSLGRVVDKLTREHMLSMRYGKGDQ